MNLFSQLLLYAVSALTVENIFFVRGAGLSRVLRAARKPQSIPWYSAAVTFFAFLISVSAHLLMPFLRLNGWLFFLSPVVLAVLTALFYCITAICLRQFLPRVYAKFKPILSPAAFNCVVLSAPFYSEILGSGWTACFGFSLGIGLSFLLSSLILREALESFRDPAVPASFRGVPAALVYAGLFSLAMAGF